MPGAHDDDDSIGSAGSDNDSLDLHHQRENEKKLLKYKIKKKHKVRLPDRKKTRWHGGT